MKRSADTAYRTQMGMQPGAAVVATAVCFVICALLALAAFAPRAMAATVGDTSASKPVIIPVEQKYTSNTSGVPDEFEYRLEAVSEGAPMPAGSVDGVFSFKMKGSTLDQLYIEFANAPYNEWCSYKIYQVQPSEGTEGFMFDPAEYNIEAILWGNDETQVVASTTDEEGVVTKPLELAWAVNYDSSKIDEHDTPTDKSDDPDDPDNGDEEDDDGSNVDDDDTPLNRFTHAVQTGDLSVIVPTVVLALAIVVALVALVGFVRRKKEEE